MINYKYNNENKCFDLFKKYLTIDLVAVFNFFNFILWDMD